MDLVHWIYGGLGILGTIAITVVSMTWGLRGRFDHLATEIKLGRVETSTEIKLGRAETNTKIDGVMAETKLQTVMINHVAADLQRVEGNQRDHERQDESRFTGLANLAIVQAEHGKSIQLIEQRARYSPQPFPPPKGSHG